MIGLWAKIKVGLGIAGAVIIAIGIAFLKGRRAGVEHMQAEQSARRIQSMKDRKDVDDEVANLGSNDVDERFTRWMRDDDR